MPEFTAVIIIIIIITFICRTAKTQAKFCKQLNLIFLFTAVTDVAVDRL